MVATQPSSVTCRANYRSKYRARCKLLTIPNGLAAFVEPGAVAPICRGSLTTHVSWKAEQGFGIFFGKPGDGERPSETYTDARLAARRLQRMAFALSSGRPDGDQASAAVLGQVQQAWQRRLVSVEQAFHGSRPELTRPWFSMLAFVEPMGGQFEPRA
jgi:hypothetical protein